MNELCLVGTLPHDPQGFARVLSVLEAIQPDAIAVDDRPPVAAADEFDASRLADPALVAFWRQRLSPKQVHYAAFASAEYAARHGLAVHYLQQSDDESDEAAALAELDADTLRGMAEFDWSRVYIQNYARARRDLEVRGCIELLMPDSVCAGDAMLAEQVRHLLQANQRLVVVCDVRHLYFSDAALTLYTRVGGGSARRFLTDGQGELPE